MWGNLKITPGTFWHSFKGWADTPRNRPKVLLLTVFGATFGAVLLEILMRQSWMTWLRDWISSSNFIGDIFFPATKPEWKDKLTALIPIIGLPVAFWLWQWRDRNVQDQIENARKDVNLKEFQEIQLRAAGVAQEHLSKPSKQSLQIAALYQLIPFLKGEYGVSFRQPAWELLFAGHEIAMSRILSEEMIEESLKIPRFNKIKDKINTVDVVRKDIISFYFKEAILTGCIFLGRQISCLHIDLKSIDSKVSFMQSSLIGCYIHKGHPELDLSFCDMQGSYLFHADLEKIHFANTDLRGARFCYCTLNDADFRRSIFDDDTEFEFGWSDYSDREKDRIRQQWRKRGLLHYDELPQNEKELFHSVGGRIGKPS